MRRYTVRLADWASDEAKLRTIRHGVFCVEQSVPESLEWDGVDGDCRHVLAEDEGGAPIGCGRLLPDGHVGRMAVVRAWRGQGVGNAMLTRLIALARERGDAKAMLNAQTHAMPFYARHGFVAVGDPFDEAGIPHQAMETMLADR
ncbi:MAG TPA: GNAT family N-acetyltransferase [Casimicrobiaceae bacterium]|nr:GNAT family N-acetyltransferase [Casimicrobiaceae bacterium]